MHTLDTKLANLPTKPGVYIFKNDAAKVLYVGKAKNLRNRIRSYLQKSRPLDPRMQIMVKKISDLEFIVTDSEVEALILEANLIKKHKPRYNVNLKDDKSFPYIRITNEDFPRVFPTRKVIRDGSYYFGPYTNVKDMRFALTTLSRLFAVRSCKYDLNPETVAKKKVKLCLDYYIFKCKGPCQGMQNKQEYGQIIGQIKQFLKGKTDGILSDLKSEMDRFARAQKYEEAARVRDKIEILEKYRYNQKVVLSDHKDRDIFALAREDDDACAVIFKLREGKIIGRIHYYLSGVLHKKQDDILEHFVNQYYNNTDEIPIEVFLPFALERLSVISKWLSQRIDRDVQIVIPKIGEKKKLLEMCTKNAHYLLAELKLQKLKGRESAPYILKALQRDLKLSHPPKRIECFDISNIQGSDPVASMVCFIDGKPQKSEYRKFRIQSKSTPDDFAMMREVIKRRYQRVLSEKKDLPDLIVVDGGKGQLSSAVSVLRKLGVGRLPIIGLAKRLEEIFIPGYTAAQMLPKTSSSLKLLQQLRDEAHRFAVSFHRTRRSKRTLTSTLDNIPGIGPKRRELLLRKFGSVNTIKKLPAMEIHDKSGIPLHLATRIYQYFNQK